ncbi:MAG: DUF4364 family protein [Clostridia bacterium]
MELTDKFEIKVFILFLLKNIKEPLEFSTINDIVIQDGFVNYFDFSICFAELLECGQISEIKDEKCMYVISSSGEEAVGNVEMKIFNTVREKALRSALRLLAFYKSGSKITSNLSEQPNGFKLQCKIEDNKNILLNIEVFLTEKYYAEKLKTNFDDRAESIYRGVLALLSGDVNYIFEE